LPPYIQKYDQFKAKGVDVLAFVAANDEFVMSAWGRVVGAQDKVRHICLSAITSWSNLGIHRLSFYLTPTPNLRQSLDSL
jgi:alkyl hydroperoxide reductase 1